MIPLSIFKSELKWKSDAGERSGMKMDMTKKMMVRSQETELSEEIQHYSAAKNSQHTKMQLLWMSKDFTM